MAHSLRFLVTGKKIGPHHGQIEYYNEPRMDDHRLSPEPLGEVYRVISPDGCPVTDDMLRTLDLELDECPRCRRNSAVVDNRGNMGKAIS